MAVTINQIAEKAGVSRGTVDRALNNRERINPEVAEQIRQLAQEMGYIHRERKKRTKSSRKIGVVTQLADSAFMLEVNRGIRQARKELAERGIEVVLREGKSVDEKEQLALIRSLEEEGIQGLAIMPSDSEAIRTELNRLSSEQQMPVVTFNSDIVGTKRLCYVGMDNCKSGRTAAGLMGMMTGGVGKVLIITGFFSNTVNYYRVEGFVEEIKKSFPELEIAGVHASFDDDAEVEKIIVNTMLSMSGINGIFVVSAGQEGIARAFQKLGIEKRPHTIIYDLTPENRRALAEETADFLIDQNGYIQGYEPPFILADLLQNRGGVQTEYRYTDINIKTKYNL